MKVLSYDDYMNEINGRGDTFVFRGQHSASYILVPSGLRDENKKTADKKMFEFVDEIQKVFGFDELTCIEIAQHFALPTRMLDFSYSYDVALFFACYDRKGKHVNEDGKVYIFNKTRYEKMLKDKNKLSSQVNRNNKFLYNWLERYIVKKSIKDIKDGIDLPIFVDATEQFDRLHMQKGLFLLWGKDELSFEEIMKNEDLNIKDYVDEVVIDAKSKPIILEELKRKHISEDTLYMNTQIIKDLVSKLKDQE